MDIAKIRETYINLMPVIESISVGSPTKDPWLQVFIGAALAKSLEFNLVSFEDANSNVAFFNASGLRGLCEDFITLKYFKEIVDLEDAQDILSAWGIKQMAEGIKSQNAFFKVNRLQQPVIPFSSKFQYMLKKTNDALKSYRSKYGWVKSLPRIVDMADACSLRPLYDYLYSATSKSVHFSPHFLMRMGWGDIKVKEPSFCFSTKNFQNYYVQFNRFYGTFLFIKFCQAFGDWVAISDKVRDPLILLNAYLEDNPRWPEIVTFEEMNLDPPNYGVIHVLMPLLKDLSEEERREMIQGILTERNQEQISRMSVGEKRDSLNHFFRGQILDKVATVSESKLDQILQSIGKQLVKDLKSDIQVEDVAKFLAAFSQEDLIRYIERVPIPKNTQNTANEGTLD